MSLPFSIVTTFVIEERFGFNKITPATFIRDLLKGLALAAVLGWPLIAGLMAFFQYTGSFARILHDTLFKCAFLKRFEFVKDR